MILNFFVSLVLGSGMAQIWSILNGLQVVQLLPMFHVKPPGNIHAFKAFFAEIVSVEVLDAMEMIRELVYIPEQIPFSLNF